MQKKYIPLVVLLMLGGLTPLFTQEEVLDDRLLESITLNAKRVERGGQQMVSLNPGLREGTVDRKFRRRFEYILYNETDYQNAEFEAAFPDTLEVDSLYRASIVSDRKSSHYLQVFYRAIIEEEFSPKAVFYESDLLDIGSRFFLVTGKLGDRQLDWRVCIGLNGHEEVTANRDLTLLEAYCFEAIFENMRKDNGSAYNFMNRFLGFVTELEGAPDFSDPGFAEKAKAEVFRRMRQDETLRNTLLRYYRENADNLPFVIRSQD